MNVYPCRYRGINGFGCKYHEQRWMFVPDMGQISSRIQRNLALGDLEFTNQHAQQFEQSLEANAISFLQRIKRIGLFFSKAGNSTTVGGLLLAANY